MKALLMLSALSTMGAIRYMNEAGEGGEGDGGAAAVPTRTTAHIRPNLAGYSTVKSASGSSTKICGDEVSLALVGATLEEAYGFVAPVVGKTVEELKEKYGARNVGQQRMFLGNLIRGAFASKNAEYSAKVRAAFDKHLPAFREGVDDRLKELEAEAAAAKQKKADEKAAAKKEADAKKAEAKPAKEPKPAKAPAEPKKSGK